MAWRAGEERKLKCFILFLSFLGISWIYFRKYVAQVSDAAICVEATFFFANGHNGPEAMLAEKNDFKLQLTQRRQ